MVASCFLNPTVVGPTNNQQITPLLQSIQLCYYLHYRLRGTTVPTVITFNFSQRLCPNILCLRIIKKTIYLSHLTNLTKGTDGKQSILNIVKKNTKQKCNGDYTVFIDWFHQPRLCSLAFRCDPIECDDTDSEGVEGG